MSKMMKTKAKTHKKIEVDFEIEEFKVILNSRSQRITSPRLEILTILKSNHKPLTISEIHNKTKNKRIDVDLIDGFLE